MLRYCRLVMGKCITCGKGDRVSDSMRCQKCIDACSTGKFLDSLSSGEVIDLIEKKNKKKSFSYYLPLQTLFQKKKKKNPLSILCLQFVYYVHLEWIEIFKIFFIIENRDEKEFERVFFNNFLIIKTIRVVKTHTQTFQSSILVALFLFFRLSIVKFAFLFRFKLP